MASTRVLSVLDSTQIKELSYDLVLSELKVKFVNNDVYVYDGVPNTVFGKLCIASSVGREFQRSIKGGKYPYRKVEP